MVITMKIFKKINYIIFIPLLFSFSGIISRTIIFLSSPNVDILIFIVNLIGDITVFAASILLLKDILFKSCSKSEKYIKTIKIGSFIIAITGFLFFRLSLFGAFITLGIAFFIFYSVSLLEKDVISKKNNIRGRTIVIISGGNSGIGYYMARSLLEMGFCVAVLDKRTDNLDKIQETYKNLLISNCDISYDAEVKAFVQKVIEKWGQIDILVNNACMTIFKPFKERKMTDIRYEFEVNYFGYLRLIKAVYPYMIRSGRGIIHNMSSGVGIMGFPGISGYSSAKGAIESLTRSLNMEFKEFNIVVNVMHPPLTNTQSSRSLGVPVEMMRDPKVVGRKLAKKIFSRKKVITPDLRTGIEMFITLKFPFVIGDFLSTKLTKVVKKI